MAEHDSDPLSAEERAELEQLRAEKAARAAEEKARRERAELEALRAEMSRAQKAAKATKPAASKASAQPAAKPAAKKPAESVAKPTGPAKPKSAKAPEPKQKREDMSFAVRMVTATEPKDEDDIPGMAPAQKIIIVLALIAFVVFIGYSVINSTGALG